MNELGHGPWEKDYNPSGISRAEEAALKAYPITMVRRRYDGIARSDDPYDSNLHDRYCFQKGYEQAEKDTTERAISWLKEHADDYIVDLTPSYPDAPVNIIVGGMCWEHLKNFLEDD